MNRGGVMVKIHKKKLLLLSSLFIAIIFTFTSSTLLAEKDNSISEIQEKLNNISDEEREILEFLFIQVQEIEELERADIRISEEIDLMNKEIDELEDNIFIAEEKYEKNLIALESILKSYQRMGPASYLEIILDSDNLTSLIRRINILRDLTRNTGELLDSIDLTKENLVAEKLNLDNKLELLEESKEILLETLAKKQELVEEKEAYLASLEGDKELYIQRLDYIAMIMDEVRIIVSDFTKEFTRIIEEGNLPLDAVKETITLKGVKGTIREDVFNNIIASQKGLPKMEIKFLPGKIELNAPEKNLYLAGKFVVVDGQVLKFDAEEGSFYGMQLEKSTIDELFKEGDFILNLEPLIGKNILKSVEIMNGYMEILVGIKLF